MFLAFLRTLGQFGDPVFRGLLLRSAGFAIAATLCLWGLGWTFFYGTTFFESGWLEGLFDLGGFVAIFLLTLFLFPGFVTLSLGFFLEELLAAVEKRDYPDLAPPRRQGVVEVLRTTAKFTGVLVVLNLLFLPAYFFPFLGIVLFLGMNGYLLGREYYELVAMRRLDPIEARAFRNTHRGPIFFCGITIALFSILPGINLVAPAFGAAMSLHLFERLRKKTT